MDSKITTNHFTLSHLAKTTSIKTSKNWVLPPRPRPGRKPNHTCSSKNVSSPVSASLTPISSATVLSSTSLAEKPKKTYKKRISKPAQVLSTQFEPLKDCSPADQIELALKQIKDENKVLKVELSKLVSDLKTLQSQSPQSYCQQHSDSMDSLHKKRNHLEMESMTNDDLFFDKFMESGSDEDDISSQISTPSLISNTSSLMSHSVSSLASIKEEDALKIDDFLTTSYFDIQTSNSISTPTMIRPLKPSKVESPMLSPPSLPVKEEDDSFQFKFLEQEIPTVKTEDFNSLFDVTTNEQAELFDW